MSRMEQWAAIFKSMEEEARGNLPREALHRWEREVDAAAEMLSAELHACMAGVVAARVDTAARSYPLSPSRTTTSIMKGNQAADDNAGAHTEMWAFGPFLEDAVHRTVAKLNAVRALGRTLATEVARAVRAEEGRDPELYAKERKFMLEEHRRDLEAERAGAGAELEARLGALRQARAL